MISDHYALRFTAGLLFFSLACAGRTSPSPSTPSPSNVPVRVALSVAAKTIDPRGGDDEDSTRQRLAQKLNDATGHNVIVIRRPAVNDPYPALLQAAQENARAILIVTHPTGVPGEFVGATLQSIQDDEILGDTAVPVDEPERMISALTAWYASVASKVEKVPPLDRLAMAKHFKRDLRCNEALKLLEDFAPEEREAEMEAAKIREECGRKLWAPEDKALTYPIRLRTENVPSPYSANLTSAIEQSGIVRLLQTVYREFAELLVGCGDECLYGRIRLTLPFKPTWYGTQEAPARNPMKPYERLAAALLRFQHLVHGKAPLSKFPIELVLKDFMDNSLTVNVAGTPENPKFTSNADMNSFFQIQR